MEVDETCKEESTQQEMSIEDQFRNRMRKLYPAVDESITPLPRFWTSHKELSSKLIIQQGTRVEYKGPGSKGYKDAASARTNTEIPAVCGMYYFEITVISKGRDGYIGVGLVGHIDDSQHLNAQQGGYNRLPGWDQDSYGYHGDDGNAFSKSAHGQKYGPIYGSGDIVGCCINIVNRTIFFTKNGSNLGVVFEDVPDKPMYPTVGLQTPGELIEANFGEKPFAFDFESYLADFRRDQIVQIKNFSVGDAFQQNIQKIIANYLHYQGYSKAAAAFEEATQTKCQAEIEVTKKTRIGIVSCILRGELTEAIARLSTDFPNLLESNHELVFQLKFQQLIEIIGGTESEMKNYKDTENSFAQSDVDKGCENLARDIGLLLSAGISDYSPKLESVFRRRTDESWRPDRVQNRVNLPQSSYEVSEIVDYRTSISDLLEDSSEKIRKLLSGADQGVSELQETLLDLYKKKVRVTYNETEVKTLDKKYYFNAGYTNTEVENLEEDDPYSSIRQRIESLRLNKCFGQGQINVSFEQSTVHVPFNVYSLSDDVLTTASYSTGLDKTFENNAKNSKVLSWQYFASSKGLSRFYPGLKWKLEDEIKRPIDYDARFESWYASSINYPKEIIIMVDSSGSMKGYRKVLAILTIRTIIDSLSDQDFFNVIHFESTPSYLHGCFERTLVRATDFNKQQLKVLLQSMKASNVADFNKAINETYKVFKEFSESQFSLTQNYYPAARGIMMLSDGALEDYAEAFNNASIALNDSNINFEDIRVFTYLIGKDLKHQMPLKNIACARRGYYTHIASPADVKNNVMEYFHTMNRPLVNQDVYGVKPQWSPMYSSSLIGGLKVHGLVVSATQAVYAKDTVTNSGELLGVVGTDVPLVFLEQYLPKPYILGPHGYAFITNANGQLLSHPDLQIREENGSMKTTYRSMTLITMELYRETPSRKKDIMDAIRLAANGTSKVYKRGFEARRIIDCGSAKISCRKLAVDTENVLTDYSFIGLNENFVLGIAQPRLMKNGNLQFAQNTEKLLLPKNKMIRGSVNLIQECSKPLGNPGQQSNRKQLICEFYNGVNSNTLKLAGNWEFCKFQYYLYTDGQRCAPIEQTQALLDYVSSNRKGSTNVNYNCDDSMIDSLLYDIHMTAILPGMWADYLRPTGVTAVIDFAYVLTRTGLLRFYDNSRTGNVVSIDLLEPYDIGFEKFSYSRLFRIAASYKKGTTVYLLNPKDSQKYLTARTWSLGESVNFKPSKFSSEYHVAMLTEGYQIRRDYLVDLIRQEAGDLQCKNINAGNTTQAACNNNIKDCYLLDDYGTIFVSANKSETGLTLAAADSKLMQAMKTDKIFIGKGAKDYQATCSEVQTVNDQDEDGINLKTEFPINTKEDLKNPSKPSQDDDITNEYNKARPCLKEFTIYHINKAFTEDLGKKRAAFCKQEIERGQDECSTRSYSLRKIKNTNLSLLVADSCCTLTGAGSCPASENILTPEKFLSELTPKEKSLTKDALCANLKEDNIRRVLLDKLESTDNITQSPCSSSAIKIVFSNSLFFRMILFYLLNLMFT